MAPCKYKDCTGKLIKAGDVVVHAAYPSTVWTVVSGDPGELRLRGLIKGKTGHFYLCPGREYNLSSEKYRIVERIR